MCCSTRHWDLVPAPGTRSKQAGCLRTVCGRWDNHTAEIPNFREKSLTSVRAGFLNTYATGFALLVPPLGVLWTTCGLAHLQKDTLC